MRVLLLLCFIAPAFCDEINSQVVGGSNTNIANYPHQLSLRVSNSHSCGASLISGTKAVTAAHCGGGSLGSYSVLAGTSDRTNTGCATCALRSLSSFPRHASFVNSGAVGYPNDIATLHFSNIPTNANTAYIALATGGTYAGQNCQITGWGRTSATSALPVTLQVGTMTVLTNAACASAWSSAQINNGHVCVSASSVSACSGDSGGPLECGNTLVGATSWGQAQCNPSFPSVYSRISFFNSWINSN